MCERARQVGNEKENALMRGNRFRISHRTFRFHYAKNTIEHSIFGCRHAVSKKETIQQHCVMVKCMRYKNSRAFHQKKKTHKIFNKFF